ncbi:hypothetical protein ZIOFF_074614 [Zingiber officinale]|uniref:Major facilitator superfamily (MFS) profile domain-containing protein n=1 Tax=Zingiber officinale TaxID=94328 RepID=A0A8J5CR06_ZINOF|nr:hypothetical protein ZIOFF_074614 [Zingiber officinale]
MELLKKMRFPKRYSIILLTFICTSVCYLERIGFSIAYTAAADSIGVNQSSKGLILSVFYYGYVVSQVPGGLAAQYVGGRRVLLFSFLLWSLTCAFAPLDAGKVNMMVVARFLVGVAQGFIFPSIHTILAQWVPPHERSRSVSLTTSGMYLGAAVVCLCCQVWFSSDPVRSEHPKAAAVGFGEHNLHAIMVNNFTFHYTLYVLMNWLPTYFELGLQLSLQDMGSSKMIPYFNMFIFSNTGGILADHLITRRFLSVTKTRKLLNTIGFVIAALALMAIPLFRNPSWTVICSSISLGFLALGRAGFAVNHMDMAPRYAGIVMGVSNTAGTLAGIVGVGLTGRILEAAKSTDMDLTSIECEKIFE